MEAARLIDWRSADSHLLLNPRLPDDDRLRLERLVDPGLRGHVWLATSGTSGALRLVALSKEAMLASAAAVNRHLGAGPGDGWLCVLPSFHVGGLAIHARAFLAGSRVVSAAWDAAGFAALCARERIAFASLVPAQVHDLVNAGMRAPGSLRAIVVGGGRLAGDLYAQGRGLGWPLLPSYGMTECCSQVATATLDAPELRLLSHLEARVETDGRLAFRGPSLLTAYGEYEGDEPRLRDPKAGGWFVTEDLGELSGDVVRVHGRAGETIKVGGELVALGRLDAILESVAAGADAAVIAVTDERLGHVIHLAVAAGDAEAIASAFNARVLPFERVRRIHRVAAIPRSPLGKLLRARLVAELEPS